MELIIHSYGYSELIFHVLQGLAMFRQSNFYPAIINTMALSVTVFYAMQMAASKAEGQWRQYIMKGLGMVVFINALLLPNTSMYVKDHVEKTFWKVDHIPYAFAIPIGAVENFGHLLTMGFDQVFNLVGSRSSLMYYHYGTIFGARLSKEILQAKIRDPKVVGNMRNFIERCVMLPAMIGHKFTKEELLSTTDMWKLISENAGSLSRTDMVENNKRKDPSPTCKQAVSYFERKFLEQITNGEHSVLNRLMNKFRGVGDSAEYNSGRRRLNQNLGAAITSVYGDGHKVESIIKNNMMINSLNSYRSGKYATARAQMHQEAGGLLSGDMAEKTLTGSLALMKVIVYSAFIFLLPMLLLAGGINKYKSWIIMAFSLSLWPPLYTIINMVIDFAYEPAKIVSYSSWSTEKNKFDSIASLAASLSISIPFLAYYMTRLGEGGFTQLAGTIMSNVNAATSVAAGEKASGSRNWDNDNIDNSSRNNSNSHKTNHDMQYVNFGQSFSTGDGSMARITPTGQTIISGGPGQTSSSGEATYRSEDGVQSVFREGLSMQQSLAETDSRSFSTSQAKTISKQAGMLETIANSARTSEGYAIDTTTEEGQSVMQVLNEVDKLEKSNNYGWQQNAETVLGTHAQIGFDGKIFGGNVSTDGKVSAGNNSDQSNNQSSAINRENNSNQIYNNVTRALNSDAFTKDKGVTEDMSKGLHESYEETQRAEKQLAQRYETIDTYNKALDHSKTYGASTSRDMYQDVLETYAHQSGKNMFDAKIDVDKRTPAVRKIYERLAEGEANQMLNQIHAGKSNLSLQTATNTLDNTEKNYNSKIDSNVGDIVKVEGYKRGLNPEAIKHDIANTEEENKNKFSDLHNKSDDMYKNIKDANTLEEKVMARTIEKNEEDRIGNGIAAKTTSNILGKITVGKAGSDIGRPKLEYGDNDFTKPGYNLNGEIVNNDDIFKPYSGNSKNSPQIKSNKNKNRNNGQRINLNTLKQNEN